MTRSISATDARIRFGKLLREVAEQGETVVVERSGKAQAIVMPIPEYHRLQRLDTPDARWQALLDQAIESVDRAVGGREIPAAEDVIRSMREERDAELVDLP